MFERASVEAPSSNSQWYSYRTTYDPSTGLITVYRDGQRLLNWTDSSPLASGGFIALYTSKSAANFDDIQVTGHTDTLAFLHTDHLGSTSLMTDASGYLKAGSIARYLPYGSYRTAPTASLTERGFTGHRNNDEIGLIYMNARFYAPYINRFISADTIVPDPSNPQSYNRYSYVVNRPVTFTDPSGHYECMGADYCVFSQPYEIPSYIEPVLPSEMPSGLNAWGEQAWHGLTAIQSMEGGWWGNRLDSHEAMILVLNHELGGELRQGGPSEPRDVIINQYSRYCTRGAWSAECLNKFWGYSHVIRESRVVRNYEGRLESLGHRQWIGEMATGILNHSLQPVNPALMHYGNALINRTAERLLQDYKDGITLYASYVSVSATDLDPITNSLIVDSVFVVQTYGQWIRTGTLQWWIYPEN
jgi:RHS repeat-associated protein